LIQTSVEPLLVWKAGDEAFGMDAIGGIENGLALFENERSLVVVDHSRGEQTQPGVAMFLEE
jgi:hypothetical protein